MTIVISEVLAEVCCELVIPCLRQVHHVLPRYASMWDEMPSLPFSELSPHPDEFQYAYDDGGGDHDRGGCVCSVCVQHSLHSCWKSSLTLAIRWRSSWAGLLTSLVPTCTTMYSTPSGTADLSMLVRPLIMIHPNAKTWQWLLARCTRGRNIESLMIQELSVCFPTPRLLLFTSGRCTHTSPEHRNIRRVHGRPCLSGRKPFLDGYISVPLSPSNASTSLAFAQEVIVVHHTGNGWRRGVTIVTFTAACERSISVTI